MTSPRLTPTLVATLVATTLAVSLSVTALVVSLSDTDTDTTERSVSALADQTVCRTYSLDMATARPDDTVDDIDYAVSYSDNSEYPEEWFDELSGDAARNRALKASIKAASDAARTPGISDDLFDLFRDVTTSLTNLQAATVIPDLDAAGTEVASFRAAQDAIEKACD